MIAILRTGWRGFAGMQTASIRLVNQLAFRHRGTDSNRPRFVPLLFTVSFLINRELAIAAKAMRPI
jgi:hypothetical protein